MARNRVTLTRRTFLELAAAGAAAGAAAAPERADAFGIAQAKEGLAPEREVATYCEMCFWNCGALARVRKNRVIAMRGNPKSPNSRGKLCGRGQAGPGSVVDEDRLKYPMIRTGRRGEGRFRRAGWEEAYRVAADGFKSIKERHGPQALALLAHGTGGEWMINLMAALGTSNIAEPAYAQCTAARNLGYKLTYGQGFISPEPLDFDETRCMVFFGSHLGENAHNSQMQDFVKARARGANLIVLDPRMSTAAARADIWLPVRPGYDTAVILAWMHLLVKEGTYDRKFVQARTVGFEELAKHVAPFTPEWAAAQAGVPADSIVEAYRLMVKAMPAVLVHPGRHTAWYGEADTQRARAQAILTALLGAWWRPGGIYRQEKPEVGEYPTPDLPELPKPVDRAAGKYALELSQTTTGIRDATRTGKPYPIKGWLVYATNPLQSLPNPKETMEAIANLDMLVVSDIVPSEITMYADVIFPEDVYLERYDDLQLGGMKTPWIGLREPAVKSPYDTRPGWRIAKEFGKHLGLGDYYPWATIEEYLDTRLATAGLSLAKLRAENGIHLVPRKTPLYLGDSEPFQFKTPSGKIELYSKQLADAGFDPLPVCKGPPDPPPGKFRLLYGRSPLQTFGRTQNNPVLFDLEPTNALWMHPAAAAALGLGDGEPVLVANDDGGQTGPLPLKVTERIPERAVYMTHGYGHWSWRLRRTYGRGGSDTEVIHDYAVDPISGATGMRTQLVTVRRAGKVA